ncbi:MAG: tetratricopeptide repeat protein [Clostridia bacterium]|nr:tetratricopeptide repeat protein [Clostridia bacterium]
MIPRERVLEKLDSLLRSNDYKSAKQLLEYWLSEAMSMGDMQGVLLMQNELMGLCRKLGERENALGFAQSALEQVGKMGIGDNVGAATTYLNSATVCKAFSLPEDAINLFELAREIYERDLKPDDDRLAGLYNNMGLALVDLGRFSEADELYKKALSVLDNNEGKEPEQAITYLNMATAAETQFGLEEAAPKINELLKAATERLDIGRDRTDGNYAFVCEKCASVFGYYGRKAYEIELLSRTRRIYEGN